MQLAKFLPERWRVRSGQKSRECLKCKSRKPLWHFYRVGPQNRGVYDWCKACCSLYPEEFRQRRKIEIAAYHREYDESYRKIFPERIRLQSQIYYASHRDEKREYDRKYRQRNKEKINARQREWWKQNREACREWKREYYRAHRERILAQNTRSKRLRHLKRIQKILLIQIHRQDEPKAKQRRVKNEE